MNKKFFIVSVIFASILAIMLIILIPLASKERVGYVEVLKNNGASYSVRIKYYDSIFRNGDILRVYPKQIDPSIGVIKWNKDGSPFGEMISEKNFEVGDNISDITYTLKVKSIIILLVGIVIIMVFLQKIKIIEFYNFILEKLSKIYIPINIRLSSVLFLGYLFLLIPYVIFIIGWTKIVFSIPITILLIVAFCFMTKDTFKLYNKIFTYNLLCIILIAVLIVFVVVISGVGEIFPPSGDMLNGRNPMFRDLVNFKWPVVFPENGRGMVFYFAHWLVPSLFGKLFGFGIGKLTLVLWTSFGIFIAFTLLLMLFDVKKSAVIFLIFLMFILFDRLPINGRGYVFYEPKRMLEIYYLFNQSIGIWVMTVLFLHQRGAKNFVFLGLLSTLYSAYAIIGILPFMIIKAFFLIKENYRKGIKEIFSIENIIFTIAVFPILFIFLSSNSTTEDGFKFFNNVSISMFIYYINTFIVYMFLIYKDNKKNPLFYTCLFVFIGTSFVQYAGDWNFNRVNIPAFFVMFYLIVKYLIDNKDLKYVRKYVLIFCLCISAIASLIYISDRIHWFTSNNFKPNTEVGRTTLNIKEIDWNIRTTTSENTYDNMFFKHIAKINKNEKR